MNTAPAYTVYRCDTCEREIEILRDARRPDPVRCNITQKCRGKLQRTVERNNKTYLLPPIVPGLEDFIPRGTQAVPAPALTVLNPITVYTAEAGIIALSVIHRVHSGSSVEFTIIDETGVSFALEKKSAAYILPRASTVRMVLFEISEELLTGKKYIYSVQGPVKTVSGQDDSPEGKNLRFTSQNQVVVFVNGVKLESTAYDLTVDDQITFTPTIYDTNNVVEVFVYQDLVAAIDSSKQVVLEFRSLVPSISTDLALRELNCWGNYGASVIDGVERYVLFCTDLTQLNTDKSYGVARIEATSTLTSETRNVKLGDAIILLGREPFSFRDKELYAYLNCDKFATDQAVMTYRRSNASGALQLTVDDSTITQVFNPVGLSKRITATSSLVTTAESKPGTPLEGTENLKPKYILGPA